VHVNWGAMLHNSLLPDNIIFIIFENHFKDVKNLSQVSKRLKYNYDKIIPSIKSGDLDPDIWIESVSIKDYDDVIISRNTYNNSGYGDIEINDIDVGFKSIRHEDLLKILIQPEKILDVYYYYFPFESEGGYEDTFIYKTKSSKEIFNLLSIHKIEIPYDKNLYIRIHNNVNSGYFIHNISIHGEWDTFLEYAFK
jgi:hypothetical protein